MESMDTSVARLSLARVGGRIQIPRLCYTTVFPTSPRFVARKRETPVQSDQSSVDEHKVTPPVVVDLRSGVPG